MLTERQLEYVVAIAETGTFTAAAERCRVATTGRFGAADGARLGGAPRRSAPGTAASDSPFYRRSFWLELAFSRPASSSPTSRTIRGRRS
jgi:hypothetical protein